MPKDKTSSKKGEEEHESFSIILGTRRTKTEGSKEKEEEPKPAPPKKVAPKKPPKEQTLDDLMKKRDELELFLASLKDASRYARFPEYAYQRTKKKNEMQLNKIKQMIRGMEAGGGAGAKADQPKKPAETGTAQEKGTQVIYGGEEIEKLGARIEAVESALKKVPDLRTQLKGLKNELDENKSLMEEIMSDEKSLARELSDIREKHSSLSEAGAKPIPKEKGTADDDSKKLLMEYVDISGKKLEMLSGKLSSIFDKLNKRIDQVSVMGESKTGAYVNDLKKQIKDTHSSLSKYMKKDDLKKMVLKPITESQAKPVKKERGTTAKPKAKKPEIVPLSDLEKFVGRDVTVECTLTPLKSIREKGMQICWYRLRDKSGESILTGCKEIAEKRAMIRGTVKNTKAGSFYIFFKRLV
jgi:hypothetical protein